MVQTVKRLLEKLEDPYLALLAYRVTPGPTGRSPAELLMRRRLRTRVPVLRERLVPAAGDQDEITLRDKSFRQKQRVYFNKRHGARPLPKLSGNDRVCVPDAKKEGTVVRKASSPRSYVFRTDTSYFRRNRRCLVRLKRTHRHNLSASGAVSETPPELPGTERDTVCASAYKGSPEPREDTSPAVRTRYGRRIVRPQRLGIDD